MSQDQETFDLLSSLEYPTIIRYTYHEGELLAMLLDFTHNVENVEYSTMEMRDISVISGTPDVSYNRFIFDIEDFTFGVEILEIYPQSTHPELYL